MARWSDGRLAPPSRSPCFSYSQSMESRASRPLGAGNELMIMSTSAGFNSASESTAIRNENVGRHYTMGESVIRAVDGVSIEVRTGEFVALLGTSGSGKSSLLNLIA